MSPGGGSTMKLYLIELLIGLHAQAKRHFDARRDRPILEPITSNWTGP